MTKLTRGTMSGFRSLSATAYGPSGTPRDGHHFVDGILSIHMNSISKNNWSTSVVPRSLQLGERPKSRRSSQNFKLKSAYKRVFHIMMLTPCENSAKSGVEVGRCQYCSPLRLMMSALASPAWRVRVGTSVTVPAPVTAPPACLVCIHNY